MKRKKLTRVFIVRIILDRILGKQLAKKHVFYLSTGVSTSAILKIKILNANALFIR